MFKTLLAVIAAGACGGVIGEITSSAYPAVAPEAALPACTQVWPYHDQACLDDSSRTGTVRIVTIHKSAARAPEATNASSESSPLVNRVGKSDRLLSNVPSNVHSSTHASNKTVPITSRQPLLGCDPAFSPFANPGKSYVYGRCTV